MQPAPSDRVWTVEMFVVDHWETIWSVWAPWRPSDEPEQVARAALVPWLQNGRPQHPLQAGADAGEETL